MENNNQTFEIEFQNKKRKALLSILIYVGCFYVLALFIQTIVSAIYLKFHSISISQITEGNELFDKNIFNKYLGTVSSYSNFFTYLITTITLVGFLFKELYSHIANFFKNLKVNLLLIVGGVFGLFLISFFSNFIILILQKIFGLDSFINNDSINQETINAMLKSGIIPLAFTVIVTVIFAPIVEEIVFRKSFFNFSRKKSIVAILLSGLIFGSIHVIPACLSYLIQIIGGDPSITLSFVGNELLYLISYCSSGIFLGIMYYLSKYNLTTTICIHLIYNLIATIMTIIAMQA